jgi:hypothetical protein
LEKFQNLTDKLSKEAKYPTVGKVLKSNRQIVKRGKIDTSNTHIHNRPLSWLDSGTSIENNDRVKLVLYVSESLLLIK